LWRGGERVLDVDRDVNLTLRRLLWSMDDRRGGATCAVVSEATARRIVERLTQGTEPLDESDESSFALNFPGDAGWLEPVLPHGGWLCPGCG
jgi:hypothetical protein